MDLVSRYPPEPNAPPVSRDPPVPSAPPVSRSHRVSVSSETCMRQADIEYLLHVHPVSNGLLSGYS